MKCGFIVKHRGRWPTARLCEGLGVSRGGFYAWLTRPQSQRARRDEVLGTKVRTSFLQSALRWTIPVRKGSDGRGKIESMERFKLRNCDPFAEHDAIASFIRN